MDSHDHDKMTRRLSEERPPLWFPTEPGEQLIGKLIRVTDVVGRWGPAKLAVLEDVDGQRHGLWVGSTALRAQFAQLKPSIGDVLGVVYGGKVTPDGGGAAYHSWRLEVLRDDETELNWGDAEEFAAEGGEF